MARFLLKGSRQFLAANPAIVKNLLAALVDVTHHINVRSSTTSSTPRRAMPFLVIIPAALPGVVTGIKLGWTLGWHGAVSAELIKSSIGLGFLLYMGRELNDAAQVVGIMVLTILFGLLLDRFFFGLIEHRIRERWGLVPNE